MRRNKKEREGQRERKKKSLVKVNYKSYRRDKWGSKQKKKQKKTAKIRLQLLHLEAWTVDFKSHWHYCCR